MKNRTLGLLIKGNPPQQVLLGFKKRGFGQGKITGIGGKVEPGETLEQATVREIAEEIGVKVQIDNLRYVAVLDFRFPAKPAWSQVAYVFLIDVWQGSPTEFDEVKPMWFAVDDLPFERMWQDARHWLPLALAGERLNAVFTFADDNETLEKFEIL